MLYIVWPFVLLFLVIAMIFYSAATLDIDEYTNKFIGRERRRRAES